MEKFEPPVVGKEKPKNVVELTTENAHYNIAYGIHQIEMDPKVIENTDAVILELITNYPTSEQAKRALTFLQEEVVQYRKILKKCQEDRRSIFLTDLSADARSHQDKEVMMTEIVLPSVESIFGVGLAAWAASDPMRNDKMTRRDFLKTGAKGLAALYLSTPQSYLFLHDGGHEPDEESARRKIARSVGNFSRAIHPELDGTALNGRNLLFAQKAEAVAKLMKSEKSDKPRLGLIVGASHFGMEDALKMDEEKRVAKLREYIGKDMGRESIIARIDFIGDSADAVNISILEDASLRKAGEK